MVINPFSVSSNPVPLLKKEVATSTPTSSAPVETVEIGAEPVSPAKKSLRTRALLGAGAAVALAVAIGGCAPLNVPPLVPGSSYQVTHQVWRSSHAMRDVCRFEGSDGTYIVTHHTYSSGVTSQSVQLPDGSFVPDYNDVTRELVHDRKVTIEKSKKTLRAIADYCLKTEEKPEGMSRTTVTTPQPN